MVLIVTLRKLLIADRKGAFIENRKILEIVGKLTGLQLSSAIIVKVQKMNIVGFWNVFNHLMIVVTKKKPIACFQFISYKVRGKKC